MAGIDDIIVKAQAEKTVIDSLEATGTAVVAKIVDLRALVAAGGNDPVKTQQALDMLDAATAQLTGQGDKLNQAIVDPPVIS